MPYGMPCQQESDCDSTRLQGQSDADIHMKGTTINLRRDGDITRRDSEIEDKNTLGVAAATGSFADQNFANLGGERGHTSRKAVAHFFAGERPAIVR